MGASIESSRDLRHPLKDFSQLIPGVGYRYGYKFNKHRAAALTTIDPSNVSPDQDIVAMT